jgi:hypothetical protein
MQTPFFARLLGEVFPDDAQVRSGEMIIQGLSEAFCDTGRGSGAVDRSIFTR